MIVSQIIISGIRAVFEMGTIKFDLEKFIGKNDFALCRIKIRALLVY